MGVIVGVDGSGRTHRLAAGAAARAVWITPPVEDLDELIARLESARAEGVSVVVDDAHRLPPEALRALATAARQGTDMTIARRPTIADPALAELDEVVAAKGGVDRLTPLDEAGTAELISRITGHEASRDKVAAVHDVSGGMPAIAAMLAKASPGEVPSALAARVHRRLATAEPLVRRLAAVLALRLDLPDDVVAAAGDVSAEQLPAAARVLRDQGMLLADRDVMIPAIAEAVLAELSPTERRRIHNDVAQALLVSGADPVITAEQLRSAGALGAMAADVYRAAGERERFADPEAALRWFAEAAEAGANARTLAAGRAEAAAVLGEPVDTSAFDGSADDASRLALVAGAVEAHDGRADRAADALRAAGPLGEVLAVPALVAVGRLAETESLGAASELPRSLRRLAEAARAARDPHDALPLFIEAAEALDYAPPPVVLPDTPHAIGALVAVTAGDAASGLRLLDQALAARTGGPAAEERHRLLRAWVGMRIGQYEHAHAELSRLAGRALSGRDRLVLAALAAGLARRSGDVRRMRDAWERAERELARRAADLFHLEVLEELVVASAKLGEYRRAAPLVAALQEVVQRLGGPSAWSTAIGWITLQAAVAEDDAERAASVAAEVGEPDPGTDRCNAQRLAARCWANVLAGDGRIDDVLAAADALVAGQLPWEASRLAGQAAIRTTDPAAARRLLERARDLTHPDLGTADRSGAPATLLSDREVEVAALVLAGRTHKEIGAQLYLSPKTVEHHVARIRTKLGVTTRAQFVAALRELLETDTAGGSSNEPPNAVS